jgi:uncharacterized protein YjdB
MDRTTKGRRKRNSWLFLSIVVIFLSSVSCDAGAFIVSIEALPDDLLFSLSPSEMTLAVGESATITASLAKANGTPVNPQALKWASTGRATVTPDGVVTGVTQGHALIVASSGKLADTTWLRIVEQRDARVGVKVSPDTVVLQWLNATATLTAEVRDDAGTLVAQPGLTWRSLNPEIAQTNDMGVVTAKGVGLALIVATAVCCDQADTAYTRVHQVVDEVVIEEETLSLSEGSSAQLRPIALDRGGSRVEGAKFQFKSADESIVRVSQDGQLTSQSAGTTTVTATSEGHSDQVSVTVSGTNPVQPPPGGTSIAYPNEPAGFVKITEHRGDPWPSDWVLHDPSNNISVIQDETAPNPGMGTIRYFYPKGLVAGTGPGLMYHGSGNQGSANNMKVNGQPVRELYLSFWIKHSTPWQQPDANVSKFGYTYQQDPYGIHGASRNVLHFDIEGASRTSFSPKISSEVLENGVAHVENLRWNIEWRSMSAGTWRRFELYSRAASAEGVRDGIVRFWVDGVLVGDHTNIRRSHHSFTSLHWSAVWGGVGGVVEAEGGQYILFNGIYASGR